MVSDTQRIFWKTEKCTNPANNLPKTQAMLQPNHQESSPHLRALTPETRLYRRNFRNLTKNRKVYKLPDPPWNSRLPKPILHGICRCRNHLSDPSWYLHHSLLDPEASCPLYMCDRSLYLSLAYVPYRATWLTRLRNMSFYRRLS